ncbi:MAG TPA: L-tyrosine/L-tryptophan isonitrile synthase family protein [Pseudonocardiaceae bacterium]
MSARIGDVLGVGFPVPYPPHPAYARPTRWVTAADLVAPARGAMDDVLAGCRRPPRQLVERVVRPFVVVFRELLEDTGPDLFTLDPATLGFELAPGGRLTGRLVVADAAECPRGTAEARRAAETYARRAAGYLDEVVRRAGVPGTRAAVDRVLAKELRFLHEDTLALLGTDHPWASFLHSLAPGQDRALRQVLRAVTDAAHRRRADPALPVPLVLVDPVLAGSPGLHRFAWDVCDAGGELRLDRPAGYGEVIVRFAATDAPSDGLMGMSGAIRVRRPAGVVSAVPRTTVRTFETLPRPGRRPDGCAVPALSHTRSLEELQLAELREHRMAREYVVRLSAAESTALVARLVERAARAAARAAAGALRQEPGRASAERVVRRVRHVLTRKQFIKGSRAHYTDEHARADMIDFVRAGRPIRFRMMGFPLKQRESGLKALGGLPDLAELGALVRLRELCNAVRQVYPPGIELTVLTDAHHFRQRALATTQPYEEKLHEYAKLVECDEFMEFVDLDDRAASELGVDRRDHASCVAHHRRQLESRFGGLDITRDPLAVLHATENPEPDADFTRSVFRDLFMSIVFSVPVPLLDGSDRMGSSRAIYDDLYHLGDDVPADIVAARRAVLAATWDATMRYVATLRADRELGYDGLFASGVRLKAGAPRPGTCGFCFLGGSCLLPWQGTGAVSVRGEVSTDFVVSLVDQGFVPVYSPLLGDEQPWMMVPVTATHVLSGGAAARLDDDFAERVRLRRR